MSWRRGEKKFLIDFSQTGYIDSSGSACSCRSPRRFASRGGELRLANLNDDLKTCSSSRSSTLLQIADTRDRALHSF